MPDQGGERTEQASPKKRQDERKKGNVFMSKDIVTVVSLVVSVFVIRMFIMNFLVRLQENYRLQIARAATLSKLGTGDVMNLFFELALFVVATVVPVMLIIGLVTFLTVGMQTRFLFSRELIKFKFNRLDPIKGLGKLFSLRSLVELAKSIVKTAVIAVLLYNNVRGAVALLPSMIDWDIMQAAAYTGQEIVSLIISVGIAFGVVAALDFLYQRWEYEKGIRMTKQEVKDEYKQMEGNPEIKSARRQKQREFAQQRMMSQVKDADVVVRNPTHFAVAMRYDSEKDMAPVILAKGADLVAQRIVEEAEKHNIATIENRPLARSLYEMGDIDEMIPAELFQPVAELLAWLYTRKNEKKYSWEQG